MTVTLHFPPEIEAGLRAQAGAMGLPIDRYIQSVLEQAVPSVSAVSADQVLAELDALADDAPDAPLLSDEAVSRETIYSRDS
ncbi:MAG: hypothetical protein U0Q16_22980 [Bryobacteraceae bacterium]